MQDYTGLLSGTHCLPGMTDTGKHMVTNKGFLWGELKEASKHWHRGCHKQEEHRQACREDEIAPPLLHCREEGKEWRAGQRQEGQVFRGMTLDWGQCCLALRSALSFFP